MAPVGCRSGAEEKILGFDISMDEVPVAEELEGAGQLLEEMPDDHLIEGAHTGIGVFGYHIPSVPVVPEGVPPLDEEREVPQSAVLHDQVDMRGGFMAVDESNDVRMVKALEDLDLRGQVILQLLVELPEVDRFDGHVGAVFLG